MTIFKGVVIEESLENLRVLERLTITSTRIETVVAEHQTPWLNRWTLHNVEISAALASSIAEEISNSIQSDTVGSWYADFKNETTHFIIYSGKIFEIDRSSKSQYDEAKEYGISLGIPPHQVDFHPDIKYWER